MIRRIVLGAALILTVLPSAAFAQGSSGYYRGEFGVFADYTRLHFTDNANLYGVGGRFGFEVYPRLQVEGEAAYDFNRTVNLDSGSVGSLNGGLRTTHVLVGPKFEFGKSICVFGTLKGGFVNFTPKKNSGGVTTSFDGDTDGAIYPAVGAEVFMRWLGMRFEVGDEIHFGYGGLTNHVSRSNNLRATFGPAFRF